jgi:thiosulfate/3-mercaptopyruvate sulfurtransferase
LALLCNKTLKTSMTYTTLVARDTLQRHLQDPGWIVFDCRFNLADPAAGELAYRESHTPNACYVHLDRDLSGQKTSASGRHPLPNPEILARKLGAWGVDNHTQVVAYDDAGGSMAARLWWLLRWLGHDAVAVLDGGFNRWREEGRPLNAQPPRLEAAKFETRMQTNAWVDGAHIERNLVNKQDVILDARAQPRFAGQVEPIDPIAGHIPGALNRPFDSNLDVHGDFQSPTELEKAFRRLLPNTEPTHVVHMCGSGVTACHNLLAMEIAGLSGSRLYAGSWSEWITDPRRPRAKGKD